jgi:putative lipoprotein
MNVRNVLAVVGLVATPFLAGCNVLPSGDDPCNGTVSGTVTSAAPLALPDDAVIRVELANVTLQDGPATGYAEQIFAAGQPVPVRYRLDYPSIAIAADGRYAVSAEIRAGDRLLALSTTQILVITNGTCNTDIAIEAVRR